MKILSYHDVLTVSDFRGLAFTLQDSTIYEVRVNKSPKPNRQHESAFPRQCLNDVREKRERRRDVKKRKQRKKKRCSALLIYWVFRGIISDVLDIFFNLTLKPLIKYQKVLTPQPNKCAYDVMQT